MPKDDEKELEDRIPTRGNEAGEGEMGEVEMGDTGSEIQESVQSNKFVKLDNVEIVKLVDPNKMVPPVIPNDKKDGEDLLNISKLAEAIARIVSWDNLQMPFSVGVTGKYGSGKSFFIEKVKENIEFDIKNHGAKVQYLTIDMGRYHDSKFIWPVIVKSLHERFHNRDDGYKWWDYWKTGSWKSITHDLGILFISLVATIIIFYWATLTIWEKIEYIYWIFPSLPLIYYGWKIFKIWSKESVLSVVDNILKGPDFGTLLDDRIRCEQEMCRIVKARNGDYKCHKIALILDNVDRCKPESVLQIIDELLALLNEDTLKQFIIPITCVDHRILKHSLIEHRKLEPNMATDYLEKLFTVCVKMPGIDEKTKYSYLDSICTPDKETKKQDRVIIPSSVKSPTGPGAFTTIELKPEEVKNMQDGISGCKSSSITPRKINQLLHAYYIIKYICWDSGRLVATVELNHLFDQLKVDSIDFHTEINSPATFFIINWNINDEEDLSDTKSRN